jgi:hypothetical protein
LAKRGANKGGLARAARLTPEQRSESARKAVMARWGKLPSNGSAQGAALTSNEALHRCLDRLKEAKTESELRRLTEELQRIVFHKQYENAEA